MELLLLIQQEEMAVIVILGYQMFLPVLPQMLYALTPIILQLQMVIVVLMIQPLLLLNQTKFSLMAVIRI